MNLSRACSQSLKQAMPVRTYSHYPEERTMPMNRSQFQPGLSMPEFFERLLPVPVRNFA
jgi:hypothetical protein